MNANRAGRFGTQTSLRAVATTQASGIARMGAKRTSDGHKNP
jgi:hypothetical protein